MIILSLILIILGVYFIYRGIQTYKSPFHSGYLALSSYGDEHNAVPTGLMMSICGIGTLPFVPYPVSAVLIMGGALLSLVGLWVSYRYFDPAWVRRLKEEPGNLYNLLRTEAARVGYKTLNKRIQSQADLEVWVEEVREQYGL